MFSLKHKCTAFPSGVQWTPSTWRSEFPGVQWTPSPQEKMNSPVSTGHRAAQQKSISVLLFQHLNPFIHSQVFIFEDFHQRIVFRSVRETGILFYYAYDQAEIHIWSITDASAKGFDNVVFKL